MNRASAQQWRVLHSYFVDAVHGQPPRVIDALLIQLGGGLSTKHFRRALKTGFARVRSVIEDDTLVYLVEVQADAGWIVLTRPPAVALGLEDTPELREAEIMFHAERMMRDLGIDVEPEDSTGEPEDPDPA